MSRQSNTDFKANESASDYHRILGKCCYYSDLDMTEADSGSEEAMCISYTYDNKNIKPVAIIDWKYPGKSLSDKYSAVQLRLTIANSLNIPMFFCITYLDEQYPIKCFYVIPINLNAKHYFRRCGLVWQGEWMSVKTFSKFQHGLRNKTWNGEEEIDPKNAAACGLSVGKLKDLPNQLTKYELPQMEFGL